MDLFLFLSSNKLTNKKKFLGICIRAVQILSITISISLQNIKEMSINYGDKIDILVTCITGLSACFYSDNFQQSDSSDKTSKILQLSALQALLILLSSSLNKENELSDDLRKKIFSSCDGIFLDRIRCGLFSLIKNRLPIKTISAIIKLSYLIVDVMGYNWILGPVYKSISINDHGNYSLTFFRSMIAVLEIETYMLLFNEMSREKVSEMENNLIKATYIKLMRNEIENNKELKPEIESKILMNISTKKNDREKHKSSLMNFDSKKKFMAPNVIISNDHKVKHAKYTIRTISMLWEALIDCLSNLEYDLSTTELCHLNHIVKNVMLKLMEYIRLVTNSTVLILRLPTLFFIFLRVLRKFTLNISNNFDFDFIYISDRLISMRIERKNSLILALRILFPVLAKIQKENIEQGKSSCYIIDKLLTFSQKAIHAQCDKKLVLGNCQYICIYLKHYFKNFNSTNEQNINKEMRKKV